MAESYGGNSLQALMARPLQLIVPNAAGEMELNQETANFLRQLETPVVVIGIVGIFRAGKSYLMNLLAEEKTGFDLGSTVVGKTKGIWIWCKPHPKLPNTTLILMDTEGLEDTETGSTNRDMTIIILTLLLSSTMIYNASQRIDNSLIKKLEFVIEASKHIQVQSGQIENKDGDFDLYFPTLVVTVRDFFLQLIRENQVITSQEYFEVCLSLKRDFEGNEINSTYNESRMKILKYFPQNKRYCFTLPKPVKNYSEETLSVLESLPESEFDPEFLKKSEEYKKFIFDKSEVKRFPNCKHVNGRMFADIAEEYVTAFLTGQMPCIESVFKLVAGQENTRLLDDCLREYYVEIEQLDLPLPEDELVPMHSSIVSNITKKYQAKIIFEGEGDLNAEFENAIKITYENLLEVNAEICVQENVRLLNVFYEDIEDKLQQDLYFKPGGYNEYVNDLDHFKRNFREILGGSEKSLQRYLEEKESIRDHVIYMDKEMTTQKTEKESKERLRKEIELREQLLQQETENAKKREEAIRKTFQDNMDNIKKIFEEQQEDQQRSFRRALSERENTNERIAREMNQNMDHLRQELENARQQGRKSNSRCIIS